MRDTSNMMQDALSKDTMMEYEGDGGGLEDLVHLATDVADSSPTIRDAAERLLTLLGVDEDHDDFLLSSSEDEGVEVDVDEDLEEDSKENARLFHQLAASLAKELKQSYQKPRRVLHPVKDSSNRDQQQAGLTEMNYLEHSCLQEQSLKEISCYRDSPGLCERQDKQNEILHSYQCLEDRLSMVQEAEEEGSNFGEQVPSSWNAGWDACATEALRYLVEDEGLPPHHPTVLALKDHLELQRERAFARYTT